MSDDVWTMETLTQIDNSLESNDLDDVEDFQLTKEQEQARFSNPVSEEEILDLQRSRIPRNTKRNTQWSVNVYDGWACARNTRVKTYGTTHSERYAYVVTLTKDITAEEFDFWMCRFICEVRRQDGSPYPSMSLKSLCLGILRYIKEEYKRFDLNLMATDNAQFSRLRATLDGQMKKLDSEGVGNVVKQAKHTSPLEEEKLWETGTFGIDNSEFLFNTVYFYNCKIFGLRAADEHSSLHVDQFVFGKDDEGEFVDFLGGTCKNNQGGLKQGGKVRTATRLFHNKVDEQLVREMTGHRSLAVRAYKCTSETQEKEISDLLQPPKPKESKIEPKTSPPKSPVVTCILPDKSDAKPVTIKCTKRNGDSFEIMF
ncbi:zinc finger MYM-type protein 3-like [Haliotis cracherodii]|uniref:zinc finger MYM-type protein 3-like n=1 Tax=Haliotis cracherodii TaxID=6455 RepID=UPI0039EC0BD8